MTTQQYQPDWDKLPHKMAKEDLIAEVSYWRSFMANVDPKVIYYQSKVGELCRLVTRMSKAHLGMLVGISYELSEITVATSQREYEAGKGKYYMETKTVQVPYSSLAEFQFVSEREEEIEAENDEDAATQILNQAFQ